MSITYSERREVNTRLHWCMRPSASSPVLRNQLCHPGARARPTRGKALALFMTSAFPQHASISQLIFDTHTHLLSAFALFHSECPDGQQDKFRLGKGVVDVVDSSSVLSCLFFDFETASRRVRDSHCVVASIPGEIGLDCQYTLSPPDVQQRVFARQLRIPVDRVPKDRRVHIHCFTDIAAFGLRLLDHFPNLHIGVTDVVCYASNLNAPQAGGSHRQQANPAGDRRAVYGLSERVGVLEPKQSRLSFSHSPMIPWTEVFAADAMSEGWDTERVLDLAKEYSEGIWGGRSDVEDGKKNIIGRDIIYLVLKLIQGTAHQYSALSPSG
ncbi:uncharacterized protein BT62DRAFT_1081164 [Guyanagaster necrorhizus]|uniref:Uncharacterized protein n=1 Tax=Guyanagaster necrorhizus TaxID=856835 RepID=A0A9P7VGF7_9AGAR|nr:uncharacterized protein BT62DRAFT_1081164 [Guyanagaster necrorhizus MCA 3950]KAG7440080.1 hypothetical protein BT62DRAFT_1081164 [Guyanagaster necrorhizus MCA 3950]